jgi:hypothetical protein
MVELICEGEIFSLRFRTIAPLHDGQKGLPRHCLHRSRAAVLIATSFGGGS